MKRLSTALVLLFAASGADAGPAAFSGEQLDALFSGKAALTAGPLAEMPEISRLQAKPPNFWTDPEGFAAWEAAAVDWYGVKPNKAQALAIDNALARLSGTDYGNALCQAVARSRRCDLEKFKEMGVEIRLADLPPNSLGDTPCEVVGTKKVITLDMGLLDEKRFKNGDISAVLAHEMSHVEDVVKFASPIKEARLATEEKAYMSGLIVYTQLYNSDRSNITTDKSMNTFMQAWRYRFDGGPLPDGFMYKGEMLTGKEFMETYMKDTATPRAFAQALARFHYPNMVLITSDPASYPITLEITKTLHHRMIKYDEWREEHGMDQDSYYAVPPPPPPPQPVQPAQPAHPVQPPAQPVHPVTPPAQPVHPVTPPAQPVHPVTPPAQPVQPAQPVHPVNPPPDDDYGGDDPSTSGGGGPSLPSWAQQQANQWINGNNSSGW